jgi:hypothetical protein
MLEGSDLWGEKGLLVTRYRSYSIMQEKKKSKNFCTEKPEVFKTNQSVYVNITLT